MASLTLYSPTTNTCQFKVRLSYAFNTKTYKKLKITKTNYGSSTSNVSSYLESRTATSSYSKSYYTSIINTGLSAGRTYKLYAYAQAQNGTWYKAGDDTITMLSSTTSEDLRIKSITNSNDLICGESVRFKVVVKNYGDGKSDDYVVKVYDENNRLLVTDSETGISSGGTANAYLDVTMHEAGSHKLKFKVDGDSNDTEYKTLTWVNNGKKAYCITSVSKALKARTKPEYYSSIDGSISCFEEVTIIQEDGPFSLVEYKTSNGTKKRYFYSDNFELLENKGSKYITSNNHKWYNPYIDSAIKTQSFNDIETSFKGHLAHDIYISDKVVKSIYEGKVVFASISGCGSMKGFINNIGNQHKTDAPDNGTMVVIEHKIGSNVFYTSYSHLKKDSFIEYGISVGTFVNAGTPIATMSGSGAVKDESKNEWIYSESRFSDHLHLALYTSDTYSTDPYGYNNGGSSPLYSIATEANCIKNANAYVWEKSGRRFYDFRKIIDDENLLS